MSYPLISVVIPCFNAADSIVSTVESVLSQDYPFFEVVVVDDCSTDSSYELLKLTFDKHASIKIKRLPSNSGGSAARNLGVALSEGEYICFLDSDDLLNFNRLSLHYDFVSREQIDASYCYAFSETGKLLGSSVEPDNFSIALLCRQVDIVSSSSLFLKRSVHEAVGGFDEAFKRQQDIEYMCRVGQQFNVCCLEDALYVKRHSGSPSYQAVLSGNKILFQKFKSLISQMTLLQKRVCYGWLYLRLAELSFSEKNFFNFIWYLFFAVVTVPDIMVRKWKRYLNFLVD